MPTPTIPGFYVEHVTPVRVAAPGDTALPLFIGYTEKATAADGSDAWQRPVLIRNFAEYRSIFGGPAPVTGTEIVLSADQTVRSSDLRMKFYLSTAIELFFRNGGRQCYVYAIGGYHRIVKQPDYTTALENLRYAPEFGLLVSPDMVRMTDQASSYLPNPVLIHKVQQEVTDWVGKQGNKFAVLDLPEIDGRDWEQGVTAFRADVYSLHLKHAAAWTPYLRTTLPHPVYFHEIRTLLQDTGGNPIDLSTFMSGSRQQEAFQNLVLSAGDVVNFNIRSVVIGAFAPYLSLEELWAQQVNTFRTNALSGTVSLSSLNSQFRNLIRYPYLFLERVMDESFNPSNGFRLQDPENLELLDTILFGELLNPSHENYAGSLLNLDFEGTANTFGYNNLFPILNGYAAGYTYTGAYALPWNDFFNAGSWSAGNTGLNFGTNKTENMLTAVPVLDALMNRFFRLRDRVKALLLMREAQQQAVLEKASPLTANLFSTLRKQVNILPPSALAAAAFSVADNTQGPWRAPANFAVRDVYDLTYHPDAAQQSMLNADASTGKSINLVRPVTGMGMRIWGTRTLDGNSGEWKYIPVRRTFTVIEQALRATLRDFVFKGNDSMTWITVRAAIHRYLLNLYRKGAFAGNSPEDAFFVRIGLNETMSNSDIQEGRMIIEVGLAVARPAEFILLRLVQNQEEA